MNWLVNLIGVLWAAFSLWSIAIVAIPLMLGMIVWKALTIPRDPQLREAYFQAKDNQRYEMTTRQKLRRWMVIVGLILVYIICSTSFIVAIYEKYN